ncbi:ABC transporter permease [Peribacillus simplex]|uniref:ABC transporter permease n=2 Tax=Peribacillus TaxID=2675229 RepID=A0AA90SMK1_9BACI|nr:MULTISPECIES: ABC transporter permease [Peribacillus]MDP1421874.1 ABC transporter permease [Peribacillus simplex]MDP1454526.1 ABC transporter permease [Peribacillus frigoritolerans]
MNNVIASDKIKLKRTFIKPLSYLYPALILVIAFLVLSIQKDNLAVQYNNMWESMVVITHFIIIFMVPMAITILTSNLSNIEHQNNSWKLLFSLPIAKSTFYFSKVFNIIRLCLISGMILFVGFIVIGKTLSFTGEIPYMLLLKEALYPYLGALPIITFQLWLSIRFKNQAFPIAIGIFGAVCMFFLQMNKSTTLLFWAYPAMMTPIKQEIENNSLAEIVPNDDLGFFMLLSIVFGLIFMIIGVMSIHKQQAE